MIYQNKSKYGLHVGLLLFGMIYMYYEYYHYSLWTHAQLTLYTPAPSEQDLGVGLH